MTDRAAEIRDDALSVLRDVLEWSLAPVLWEDVGEVLDGLGERLDLAAPEQVAALREATISLELAASARVTRVDKDAVPAPDRIRDRVNELIHELARPGPASDGASGAEGGS
jgi:hypothetical protein